MTPDALAAVRERFERAFAAGAEFPQKVFAEGYGGFGFASDSQKAGTRFWCLLQKLAAWSGDAAVNVITTDPLTFTQWREKFGPVVAVEVGVGSSGQEYNARLSAESRAADGIVFELRPAPGLAFFPPSLAWAAWAERDRSTLAFGFKQRPPPPWAMWAAECGVIPHPIDVMLEIVRNDFGLYPGRDPDPEMLREYERYRAEFTRNYGHSLAPVPDAAVELAWQRANPGQAKLREALRALRERRERLGPEPDPAPENSGHPR